MQRWVEGSCAYGTMIDSLNGFNCNERPDVKTLKAAVWREFDINTLIPVLLVKDKLGSRPEKKRECRKEEIIAYALLGQERNAKTVELPLSGGIYIYKIELNTSELPFSGYLPLPYSLAALFP